MFICLGEQFSAAALGAQPDLRSMALRFQILRLLPPKNVRLSGAANANRAARLEPPRGDAAFRYAARALAFGCWATAAGRVTLLGAHRAQYPRVVIAACSGTASPHRRQDTSVGFDLMAGLRSVRG